MPLSNGSSYQEYITGLDERFLFYPTDNNQVLSLFKKLNKSKGAGLDGISSRLILECADLITPHISIIFNSSLAKGIFPDDWKSARVTPFFKQGERSVIDNYHQISVISIILKIKWDHFISNEEVLKRSGTEDIEVMLVRSRLRWLGHVCRMDDNRPQKQFLYGELASGSRPVGRPKLRFKDSCKSTLKSLLLLSNQASPLSNQASPWTCGKPLSNIAQNGINR